MTKPRFPIEVPFRLFVAITFAGSITFHVLGLGVHTYIGHRKNALVARIERLAEIRSQLLGVEAGLAVFRDRLTSVTLGSAPPSPDFARRLFPQIRVMTLLLRDLAQTGGRETGALSRNWREAADFFSRCAQGHGSIADCLRDSSGRFQSFGRALAVTSQDVSRHLFRVERWQSRLDHWDTVLYWLTTVLGLLFMALGWRNVVLQVGNPIEDVARYLETLQEKALHPASFTLPALFSIRELRILKEGMRGVHKDSLTGVLTRQAIVTLLRREWEGEKRGDRGLSVVLFDIDHLRSLNEAGGYAAGDRLLRQVAGIVSDTVTEGSVVGRWGEDAFIVLAYGQSPTEVATFMEKIRKQVAECLSHAPWGSPVHVSGGGGLQTDEDDWTMIVRRAEEALLEAKSSGGDRIVLRDRT